MKAVSWKERGERKLRVSEWSQDQLMEGSLEGTKSLFLTVWVLGVVTAERLDGCMANGGMVGWTDRWTEGRMNGQIGVQADKNRHIISQKLPEMRTYVKKSDLRGVKSGNFGG